MSKISYVQNALPPRPGDHRQREQDHRGLPGPGLQVTLRQLYYQFIAKDLFPDAWIDEEYNRRNGLAADTKNTVKNYKKLGELVNHARLAGLIDWDAIEDRTSNLRSRFALTSPRAIVRACADQYAGTCGRIRTSTSRAWVEKDALVGVLEGICTELDVPYFSCRGYTSQSEMHAAAPPCRA